MALFNALKTVALALLGIDGTLFPKQMTVTDNAEFDYIIAGGGTAGCVLATRLVEANFTVLILEAGGDPSVLSFIPPAFIKIPTTKYDNNYRSTLDEYAARGQGNHTRLTSGNMLGGSSSLNHLFQVIGIPSDYDNWAKITGDDSWSYEKLLPYIKKGENVQDDEINKKYPNAHGTEGLIGIMKQSNDDVVGEYLEAFADVGNPTVLDLNGDSIIGFTQALLTISSGIRQAPAISYLSTVKDNPNLYVSKNTRVSNVIIENYTAVGVKAVYENVTYTFRARREVILSAGTFNTPQILMLSGIGPKEHLESLNINVIADLPVGQNLIVPAAVNLVHKTRKHLLPIPSISSIISLLNPTQLPPLLVGSANSNKSISTPNYLSINLFLSHDTPALYTICTLVYGYREEICNDLKEQVSSRDVLNTILLNFETKSRGNVRLRSTNPSDAPLITTGFFTDKEDLVNFVKKVRDFTLVLRSRFFQSVEAKTAGVDLPECADKESDSDEFWTCFILNRAIGFLYSSTCPMGSVVDSKLKVKGFKKLRVVDVSVFPDMLHGGPTPAVIATAEKAADMIKADASYFQQLAELAIIGY